VKENQTVESRPVTAGTRLDQELVIEKGLEAGETVVTEGHLRLAPGMRVQSRDARGGKKGGKGPGEDRKDGGPGGQKKGAD
jgi:multidrug efflux system membrane fusion protein